MTITTSTPYTLPTWNEQTNPRNAWEKQKTLAKIEFAARVALTGVFFTVPKLITLGHIRTPFDYNRYYNDERVAEIRQLLLESDLGRVEYCRRQQLVVVEPFNEQIPREYSLSNLARYGLLDKEHVTTIKDLLKRRKELLPIIKKYGGLYNSIKNGWAPSYIGNKKEIVKCYKRAKRTLSEIDTKWTLYRDTVIRARFPHIKINY